jgi:hypothetical protein
MPPTDDLAPTIVTLPDARGSGASGRVLSTGHPMEIHRVAAWKIITVRAVKAGIDSLLGALTGSTAGAMMQWGEFADLFTIGLSISAGTVVFSALRNTAEYLQQWDQKHPTFTA